jgi:hypothetical protein
LATTLPSSTVTATTAMLAKLATMQTMMMWASIVVCTQPGTLRTREARSPRVGVCPDGDRALASARTRLNKRRHLSPTDAGGGQK